MGETEGTVLSNSLIPSHHGFSDNPYPFPNDELEQHRLDELQMCMRTLLGGNVMVPIQRRPTQIGLEMHTYFRLMKSGRRMWNGRMVD